MNPFPILRPEWDRVFHREYPDCPASVPWDLVAPHAAQAQRNHGQSLETLARRGGLAPDELFAVMHDQPWQRMDMRLAVDFVKTLVQPPPGK
jgi:hypothetical protein